MKGIDRDCRILSENKVYQRKRNERAGSSISMQIKRFEDCLSKKGLHWVFRTDSREQMDFEKGADGFFIDMRGELSKYQLWLRRKDNQLIVCALFWHMSSSAILSLQRLNSLTIHRGRQSKRKLGYSTAGTTKKQFSNPSR